MDNALSNTKYTAEEFSICLAKDIARLKQDIKALRIEAEVI